VNILKTTNTDINLLLKKTLGKFKNNVNIFFKSLFITEWKKKQINQFSDSKLKICYICKNNFDLEKYLTIVNNFEQRRSFTKLRTSSHRLQIELGRYQGVPRHNRVCTKCSSNVIEDELHF
jgi:coenzyme F420-reducing hydrogenase alpha subunit